MPKILYYGAMLAAKTAHFGLRLLGRNASFLPGKIAVTICKDFLGYLQLPKDVICVTGTNGKTTVSNLLTNVLRQSGYTVTNNSLGSNVQAGVATALLENATFGGRVKTDMVVLEVDDNDSVFILEQAGRQITAGYSGDWAATLPKRQIEKIKSSDPEFKKSWDETVGDRMVKLVFIGQHMDKEKICAALDECLVEPKL